MSRFILLAIYLMATSCFAQDTVTVNQPIKGQMSLMLNLSFADEIVIEAWDKNEIQIVVTVSINDGKDNELFKLTKSIDDQTIAVEMDMTPWKNRESKRMNRDCNYTMDIFYTVYMPKSMRLEAETIDGSYLLSAFSQSMSLKTISGDIDLKVDAATGLEFEAKTISGDVYTDLEIEIPNKEGRHQVVGMHVKGIIKNRESSYTLETISGNIYLRKS